jgi:hypothetical protein
MSADQWLVTVVFGLAALAYLNEVVQDWWFGRYIIQEVDFEEFPYELSYTKQLAWVRQELKGKQTHQLKRASFMIEEYFDRFPLRDKVNL